MIHIILNFVYSYCIQQMLKNDDMRYYGRMVIDFLHDKQLHYISLVSFTSFTKKDQIGDLVRYSSEHKYIYIRSCFTSFILNPCLLIVYLVICIWKCFEKWFFVIITYQIYLGSNL